MGILNDFVSKTSESKKIWSKGEKNLPQGVTRTVAFFEPHPLVLLNGQGPRVWDADGHVYLDFLNNYSALIHGHAHPEIVKVAKDVISHGTVFPAPHPSQAEHARILTERLSAADKVRYMNSGTEAAMYAVRLARAYTGREVIAKARGGYNGTWDALWCYVGGQRAHSGDIHEPQPGIPSAVHRLTKVFEYNDIGDLATVCRDPGENLAAVIVEPIMAAGGLIPAKEDFLKECRSICDELGALLVLDEVQTFRLEWGGMQDRWKISPDLTVLGKIIGGGFPIGAVAGKREIMDCFKKGSMTYVNHSGTFNGNVASMRCGITTLNLLDRKAITSINKFGNLMAVEIRKMLHKHKLVGCVTGYGSMLNYHLGVERVEYGSDTNVEDNRLMDLMHLSLLLEGVFSASRGYLNLSTALTKEDIDTALEAFDKAISRVARESAS